jgi:hypothetical protein
VKNGHDIYPDRGGQGLSKSLPNPAPSKTPDQERIAQLEEDVARLRRNLELANDCLDLQKNLNDSRSFAEWDQEGAQNFEAPSSFVAQLVSSKKKSSFPLELLRAPSAKQS